MTKFLGVYRGAAVYEIEEFEASEGQKLGAKILVKATAPNLGNMKIDFVEEASSQDKALEKVKKDIDRFLDKRKLDEFDINLL